MSGLENENNLEDVCCTGDKPNLPPGASPNAYWSCNKATCEWVFNDPHVAEEDNGN